MGMADAAIFFQEDGFAARSDRIVGRPVSGLGLLRAAAAATAPGPLTLLGGDSRQLDNFIALQGREDVLAPNQPIQWCHSIADDAVAQVGTVYLHGMALLPELAWRRRSLGAARFSLCGIHHTFSTHDAIDALAALQAAPLQPWDALICTSTAAKAAMDVVMDAHAAYLVDRFGATRVPRPRMPVIPLGVTCADYDVPPARLTELRRAWRTRFGAEEADVVLLSFGRLSYLGKANPIPLFLALDKVRPAGKVVHLVMAGWFPSDEMHGQFVEAAAALCPTVRVHWLDGRREDTRREVWHAADIFVSLSDTIQESFGLTPVEAMAAGLPCVVSDWDGYRDTVVDGVTGFRVPTVAPAPGAGIDLAAWYETGELDPDGYEGFASLATAVDIEAAAVLLGRLIDDPDLRGTMGRAAHTHARAVFDWPVVYARMRALWAELKDLRAAAGAVAPMAHPLRPDPFAMFAAYPTLALDDAAQVRRGDFPLSRLAMLLRMDMAAFGADVVGMNARAVDLLGRVGPDPVSVGTLLRGLDGMERRLAQLSLGSLLKFGFLRI